MPLPKISTPTYELELPSSEKTINSYVEERKSHVREFIDLAVKCGKTIKSGDPK